MEVSCTFHAASNSQCHRTGLTLPRNAEHGIELDGLSEIASHDAHADAIRQTHASAKRNNCAAIETVEATEAGIRYRFRETMLDQEVHASLFLRLAIRQVHDLHSEKRAFSRIRVHG